MCPQFRVTKKLMLGHEDCLYLDVIVPTGFARPLPVMFWIYGGAFVFGDKWEFGLYDADKLASERGVIVVKTNYRVGALGFYALEQMRKESVGNFTGNFGIEDQQAALRWVQTNIASFGGDPKTVTIFGESAGGVSVCSHLVSPTSRGLFSAAIIESGPCDGMLYRPYNLSIASGEDHATQMGCAPDKVADPVACLRALSANEIMRYAFTNVAHNWVPTVDGVLIPDYPNHLIKKKKWAKVPIMIGTVKDEGNLFLIKIPLTIPNCSLPLTVDMLKRTVEYFWGYNPWIVKTIWEIYTPDKYANPDLIASAVIRDNWFACPTRRTVRQIAEAGGHAWLYHFTYAPKWIDVQLLGVYHMMEIGFMLNHPWPAFLHKFGDKERALANSLGTYWSNMAIHHNPNGAKATEPHWPRYDDLTRPAIVFDHPVSLGHNIYKDSCDFWDHADQITEEMRAAGTLGVDPRAAFWQTAAPDMDIETVMNAAQHAALHV